MRWLVLLGFGGVLVAFGWIEGAGHVQACWDAATAADLRQSAVIRQRQAEATVKVVTQYVDRIKVVREAGQTIIKEVPVYVSAEADAACVVNIGFVRLHDAAVHGLLPGAPAILMEPPVALRSLPSLEPSPRITSDATKMRRS